MFKKRQTMEIGLYLIRFWVFTVVTMKIPAF